jgi:homoserine O-succinyltransferase/O-acetyltransferase
MPLLLDTSQSGAPLELRAANCLTIALVNNMPDPAFETTERQFTELIRAAATNAIVRLVLFSIPEVPRSELMRQELAERYRDISELWDSRPDGLIVTGTEPATKNLRDEPYWDTLTKLIDWSGDNTASAIWSCLAAHAAVLRAEGIERRPFPEKLFGVFDCEPADEHPMTSDVEFGLRVPHSRLNDLPERALVASGYRILTRSAAAGVDMFARQDKSFQLFFQGHPEYQAATLLREYRRDVGRFLRRERESYPALPLGYFNDKARMIAIAFRERAIADRRAYLIANFPMNSLEAALASPWRHSAVGIYEKWLDYLRGRKAEQRPLAAPMRRVWRDWPTRAVHATRDESESVVEDA